MRGRTGHTCRPVVCQPPTCIPPHPHPRPLPSQPACSTTIGVCGKTPQTALLQDLLTYSLKGLACWTDFATKQGVEVPTEVYSFLHAATFATLTNVNFDDVRFKVRKGGGGIVCAVHMQCTHHHACECSLAVMRRSDLLTNLPTFFTQLTNQPPHPPCQPKTGVRVPGAPAARGRGGPGAPGWRGGLGPHPQRPALV